MVFHERKYGWTLFIIASVSVLAAGCSGAHSGTSSERDAQGPHHGQLIALGENEYFAEIVDDEEAGVVTAYMLDNTARTPAAIESPDVTILTNHEGKSKKFRLSKAPETTDAEGLSSCYKLADAKLSKDLGREGVRYYFSVTIEEKTYRSSVDHHRSEN